MRLIDADNLKTTRGTFIYQTEDADVIATEAYRWELIEREAPTVKAIPVEWIKEKLEKEEYRTFLVDYIEWRSCLHWLLEAWEEENETDR